jgi:hypothetical protein
MAEKLFLVVRSDLSPAQQAVQAAHALQEFNILHPEEARSWHRSSNHLAFLEVEDEPALQALLRRACERGVNVAEFREEDLGDSLTAVAVPPSGKSICRGLRMALSK